MREGWHIDEHVVARVAEAFGLGSVHSVSYLATGLMNRNWRIAASVGQFALKQIIDVPVAMARRNLRVLDTLHKVGVPACAAMRTPDGDPVVEVGGHGYCVLPWHDGAHPRGPDLSLRQADPSARSPRESMTPSTARHRPSASTARRPDRRSRSRRRMSRSRKPTDFTPPRGQPAARSTGR